MQHREDSLPGAMSDWQADVVLFVIAVAVVFALLMLGATLYVLAGA